MVARRPMRISQGTWRRISVKPVITTEIDSPAVRYLKASEDDLLAGLIKLRDSDVPELLAGKTAIEVQQLYVSVDFQRRGVGALLMDAAIDVARERAYRWYLAECVVRGGLGDQFLPQVRLPRDGQDLRL